MRGLWALHRLHFYSQRTSREKATVFLILELSFHHRLLSHVRLGSFLVPAWSNWGHHGTVQISERVVTYAAAAAVKSLQSCLTLCDPLDGSPPGSPVPGILQARTLEWVLHMLDYGKSCQVSVWWGFPGDSVSKESTCQCRRHGFDPWIGKILLEEMATHFSVLTWRIPWTEEPGSYSPWGRKELDTTWWLNNSNQYDEGFPLWNVTFPLYFCF